MDNAIQLTEFEATGTPPPHSRDQLSMYEALPFAEPITESEIPDYFIDATFGVKPGQVAKRETPEPGVTIERDSAYGIPHFYGDTRAELEFGIGYANAEDRLFFMDALRHIGRAELTAFGGGASDEPFDQSQWAVARYTEQDLESQFTNLARMGPGTCCAGPRPGRPGSDTPIRASDPTATASTTASSRPRRDLTVVNLMVLLLALVRFSRRTGPPAAGPDLAYSPALGCLAWRISSVGLPPRTGAR